MTPSRPYLLRAIYDWLVANSMTPYLLVDAEFAGVVVPEEHIQDGKIVLNISLTATQDMEITDEGISLNARFSGKPMQVFVPMGAALALYARENGRGMMFPDEYPNEGPEPPVSPTEPSPGKPHLTVVK